MRSSRESLYQRYNKLKQELAAFKELQLANQNLLPYYYPTSLSKSYSGGDITFTFTADTQINPLVELRVQSSNISNVFGVRTMQTARTANSVTFTVETYSGSGTVTLTAFAVATDSGVLS